MFKALRQILGILQVLFLRLVFRALLIHQGFMAVVDFFFSPPSPACFLSGHAGEGNGHP